MAILNDIKIIGRIGKDAEMRFTPAGKEVTTFSAAVNRKFNKDETDWFSIELWGALATAANTHCLKGRTVLVEGRMQFDKWEDKDGNKRTSSKLVAYGFQVLDWRNDIYGDRQQEPVEDGLDIPMA